MNPWIALAISSAVSLVAGGAFGAVINNYWISRRNKRQPIGYTIEVIHIFRKNKEFAGLQREADGEGASVYTRRGECS